MQSVSSVPHVIFRALYNSNDTVRIGYQQFATTNEAGQKLCTYICDLCYILECLVIYVMIK